MGSLSNVREKRLEMLNLDTNTPLDVVVGIDASNLRGGGGVTHLVELLNVAEPRKFGIARVVVFGGHSTLAKLPDRDWLERVNPPSLNKSLLWRALWQRFRLGGEARSVDCDILFVPGGSYSARFQPIVTMSRNMLPFEWLELRRYGWSLLALKLILLRSVQSKSIRGADGVIFLTKYAMEGVLHVTKELAAKTTIIPHGINPRFLISPKQQYPISKFSHSNPYRILYVSIVDQYKHQWHVVEAVAMLRNEGIAVSLDLVGPAYRQSLTRLQESLDRFDPASEWVTYHGAIPFEMLHQHYLAADLGLFASSCENMPNILLETMASGLPVACSNRGPMPEILGDSGVYFDPEEPEEIFRSLLELINSPQRRTELSSASYQRAQNFSWHLCADSTFDFLASISRAHNSQQ